MPNPYKMGEKIDHDSTGYKDAFHIAGLVVMAQQILEPGESVKLYQDAIVKKCDKKDRDGIIDPFLKDAILEGEYSWLFLEPSKVTNLTHTFEIDLELDELDEQGPSCKAMGCTL